MKLLRKEQSRRYYLKHRDKIIKYVQQYRRKNHKEINRKQCLKMTLSKNKLYRKKWQRKNKGKINQYARELRVKKKEYIYKILGNRCKMCRIMDKRVFQIDHINDDGYLEKEIMTKNRLIYYSFLIKQIKRNLKKFKLRYQLLCANCNILKRKKYLIKILPHNENNPY